MIIEEIKSALVNGSIAGTVSLAHQANKVSEQVQNNEMIDWSLHTVSVVATTLIGGMVLHIAKERYSEWRNSKKKND